MEAYETYEHEGVEVEIRYDEIGSEHANPYGNDGILGRMVTFHRNYIFGGSDDTSHADMSFFIETCDLCGGCGGMEDHDRWVVKRYDPARPEGERRYIAAAGTEACMDIEFLRILQRMTEEELEAGAAASMVPAQCPACKGDGEIDYSGNPERFFKRAYGATAVVRLGLIDHSGISMYVGGGSHASDSGGWDSGTIGFAYDTPETRKECGCEDWSPEKVRKSIEQEIETYDLYLTGQVFGYVVDPDGPDEESCWGYLGDEHVKQDANSVAEYVAREREREAGEVAYWAARDVLTVA